jgi:hypothetical protein
MSFKFNELMVVNLHIGVWSGFKDKRLHGADFEAEIAAMASRGATLRGIYYDWTLPWKENGDRLMPKRAWPEFQDAFASDAEAFTRCAKEMAAEWLLVARDRAEFRLVDRYRESDFPASAEVLGRYYADIDMDEVAQPLEIDESGLIAPDASALDKRATDAIRHLREKVATPLAVFVDRFQKEKGFYEAHVVKLERMATIGKHLNFDGHEAFEEICDAVLSTVVQEGIDGLREDADARTIAVKRGKKLLERLKAL